MVGAVTLLIGAAAAAECCRCCSIGEAAADDLTDASVEREI